MSKCIQKLTVVQLEEAIQTMQISVNSRGRSFILDKGAGEKVKMKDLVKRVKELSKNEETRSLKAQLVVLDLRGRAKLENSSLLTRFFAHLFQIFGNRSFSQETHIAEIDALDKVVLTKDQIQLANEIKSNLDLFKKNNKGMAETVLSIFELEEAIHLIGLEKDDKKQELLKEFESKKAQLEKSQDKSLVKNVLRDPNILKLFENFEKLEYKEKVATLKKIGDCFFSSFLMPVVELERDEIDGKELITSLEAKSRYKELRPTLLNAIKMAKYY